MLLPAIVGKEDGPYQVAVYVVVHSLFSVLVGNQLAEPDGGGRFKSADILCGHSSGSDGQHHESLHASF